MSIDKDTLLQEREVLKNDFDTLVTRIQTVKKDLGTMKSNLNAVHGAIQQVDKLLKLVEQPGNKLTAEKEKALNLATS